jgi:DNA-binding response OmpR family regulator
MKDSFMANQTILLIDPDTHNLSVMEVQLRKYNYTVRSSENMQSALQNIYIEAPDLIISEVDLKEDSGLDLCRQLKSQADYSTIPMIFLSSKIEDKAQVLSLGADDFLVKPVYMGELKDRMEILLQKKQRLGLEQGEGNRFFGRLEEMALLDLLQIIDVSQRSGELKIEHKGRHGHLWFKDGILLDALMDHLDGVDAIYRLLTWDFGQYEFDFTPPDKERKIGLSIAEVKAEGMRRLAQWNSMCEQLPSMETIFRVDQANVQEREDRGEKIDTAMQTVLYLFDSQRSMQDVIDQSSLADLDTLRQLTQLYFEGLVYEVRERTVPELQEDAVFLDAASTQEPPPIDNEPYSFATQAGDPNLQEPPPISEVSSHTPLPEEGQELLADLYASVSNEAEDEIAPPPVPEVDDPPAESQAQFSTLFGEDGAFDFDDSEQDFFAPVDSLVDFEETEKVKKPLTAGAKVFLVLALSVFGLATFMMLRDSVSKIELNDFVRKRANWHHSHLSQRNEAYLVPALAASWEINISKIEKYILVDQLLDTDSGNKAKSKRKLNTKEKRRIGTLIKEAHALHDKGENGDYNQGAKLVEQALAIEPNNLYALMLSAKIHMELGQDKTALSRLKRLMSINPKYSNTKIDSRYQEGTIYVLIGSTFQIMKKPGQALKFYEDYLRLFPTGNHVVDVRKLINQIKR